WFRRAGLAAILFSLAVLAFLLVTMTLNGIGGFQRATLKVPVDFRTTALSVPAGVSDETLVMQSLESQGLAEVVAFSAEQTLGEDAAGELSGDAWRIVAETIAGDPDVLQGVHEFHLPASENLAGALSGEGRAELQPLARRLASEGTLSE